MPGVSVPMERLIPTLDALKAKGLSMGIVTNGGAGVQHAKVDAIGVRGYMAAVVVSEEGGYRKPDVRIFEAALSGIGVRAEEACFLGDNPAADVSGAQKAGLRGIWMAGSKEWPEDQPPPKWKIDRLEELVGVVGRLDKR